MPENNFCEIVLGKLPTSYNNLRTTLDTIGEAELSWEKVKGLILTVADRAQISCEGESFCNALMTKRIKNMRSQDLMVRNVLIAIKWVIWLKIVGVNPRIKRFMLRIEVMRAEV